MAKFYKHLLLLTSAFLLLSSCQEGGDAGDLLGSNMWATASSYSATLLRAFLKTQRWWKTVLVSDLSTTSDSR